MHKFVLLFLLLLSSCQKDDSSPGGTARKNITPFRGMTMTIAYHIEVGRTLDPAETQEVQNVIDGTFHEIDMVYNKWNPNSELSELNRMPAGQKKIISPQLAAFLKRCDYFVKISEGRFDPTVEPLQELWEKHLEANSIPSREEIEAIRPAIGWDNIVLENCTFMKKHDATSIDLGGIAKGYAVDLLCERIEDLGYPDVFVEWGGEVRAAGHHPQGRSWAVYISNLEDTNPEHALAYIPLNDQSIATSGDYFQQWTVTQNGQTITYFHIIDPRTLEPLRVTESSVASSSVLAKDCTTADALAKLMLICPSIEEAKALAERFSKEFPGTAYWIMSRKDIQTVKN
jgi:thiamine biosynthesis lipoprotein